MSPPSGPSPHPHPSGLSPAAPTGGMSGEDLGPSRGGRREDGAPAAAGQEWGAWEGGGGALPPNSPRREAPNLYRRPLAHTNPDVAVGASPRHVRRGPAPPLPLACGGRPFPGVSGAQHRGSCSSSPTPGCLVVSTVAEVSRRSSKAGPDVGRLVPLFGYRFSFVCHRIFLQQRGFRTA